MPEIEIQNFEQTNQDKILLLCELRKKKQIEKECLEKSIGKERTFFHFISHYGKSIRIASGVISFAATYAITGNPIDSAFVTSGTLALMAISSQRLSLRLDSIKERIIHLHNLEHEIISYQEEIDLRYQVEMFLSYQLILASVGYYQQCLKKEWIKNDSTLNLVIQKMIDQLLQDELLESQDPERYQQLLLEREALLDSMDVSSSSKLYLLARRSIMA